ncbi:Acetyltransferase (GNAT) domain-containing protein [Micromonospora krabiensis]|uniref:Acetyltransferase (GNAT) domain-containing protein n=2 Tax=Micromonospora krabiensis TaxID=307121 RepID=A0A1C3MZK1_9ACTN|nr:Acetyltransferase (GNAT) domain-containing protein [Micromonospora krabiensis]
MHRIGLAGPEPARRALGATVHRVGGGTVLTMSNDPMGGFFNKSVGLGLTEPVTDALITEVIDLHRRNGSPLAHIQIAPDRLPADWADISARHGLTPGSTIVRLVGEVDDVKPATTDLRVGPVEDARIDEWATRVWEFFDAPNEHLAAYVAAAARTDGFRAYAGWDGDEMIAVGTVFVHGDAAHLNSAATRASHRRRGVQAALIAARAEHAAAAGARWLVSEVARPDVEDANPSLNNMVRAGLTRRYDRTDWIWRPGAGAA